MADPVGHSFERETGLRPATRDQFDSSCVDLMIVFSKLQLTLLNEHDFIPFRGT